MTFALAGKRVWVAGHRGMVGSALLRQLKWIGTVEILTADRADLDLTRQADVARWMEANRPDAVIIAAARVGGIQANNTRPVDFLYDNLMIASNVIEAAHAVGTGKLLFLGSSCIYPRLAEQPIREDSLLTGPLEPTNEWYAVAKIAGIKLCQAYRKQHGRNFISAMPTNLYGPNDNFDFASSHVLPALMRKIHAAKVAGTDRVVLWGTGTPRREFMHVDDLASACVFLLEHYDEADHINVGTGSDLEIRELAERVATTVGWQGTFEHDLSKPDGAPRKLMDGSRLKALGWNPTITLDQGLPTTYRWFLDHVDTPLLRA